MSDLIGWLRQQLDEAGRERHRHCPGCEGDIDTCGADDADAETRRVVAAHRAILDAYEAEDNADRYGGCGDDCEWKALRYAVQQIATVYSDMDGYWPEWRP